MKKENPKIRWHLTLAEKLQIRVLTRKRVKQSEIARRMGIGRDTVAKWQMRLGLPTRPAIPEEKIVELLRQGFGQARIHRMLGVSQPIVHAIMVRHGIAHKGGRLPAELRAKIVAAILEGSNYLNYLADKFGVAPQTIQRIAHEVRGCPKFKGGRVSPPLSSNFPQQPATEEFLAEKVCLRLFPLEIPPFPEILADSVIRAIGFSEFDPAQLAQFRKNLTTAFAARIAAENVPGRGIRWVN